ncbi:hypothetical protein PAMP_020453 [Pampus punctatissimus]
MMPTTKGMSHMIPNHVLRVGQSTVNQHPSQTEPSSDSDLDITLDNLNQLILELDPTFEPIPVNRIPFCISTPTDDLNEDVSHSVLVPRGCPPFSSPKVVPSLSPSIPIPTPTSLSCGPHGTVVFSGSPSSSLPPLPCGSAPRRNPSTRHDISCSQGTLRLSHSNRNSAASLLSTSTCSDTSYMLGSNLSLASEDADSPESILTLTPGSFSDGTRPFDPQYSPDKPSLKRGHLPEFHSKGAQSSPASLSGSLTDIPVLLVNGAPQLDQQIHPSPGLEIDFTHTNAKPLSPQSFQAHFNGSQPSMKFVMDTSKFWFRPHISRAEADALVKDKEPGTFVVRDSTSYRGSFGLTMKVDQTPTSCSATAYPGSLSALVYQHTVSAYALPCKLLLHPQELDAGTADKLASEDKSKTASNFIYLNAVPTEMLTGPCAVQRAVSSTLEKTPGSFTPTVVNLKVSLKGVTLTDINRKLFFRRHYPAHLLSYGGEDPENRLWVRGSSFGARMFGFVAKGVEAGTGNVCHVFAEYDPLQPYNNIVKVIQDAITKV